MLLLAVAGFSELLFFPEGTRAAGMGMAFSAIEGEASSVSLSPASLFRVQNRLFSFSVDFMPAYNHYSLVYVEPGLFENLKSGVAISFFDWGTIESYEVSVDGTPVKGGYIHPYTAVVSAPVVYKVNTYFGVAGTLKVAYDSLGVLERVAFSVDIPSIFLRYREWRVALSFRGLGAQTDYYREIVLNYSDAVKSSKFLVPRVLLGVAYWTSYTDKSYYVWDIDNEYIFDGAFYTRIGLEYHTVKLWVRAGVFANWFEWAMKSYNSFGVSAGLSFPVSPEWMFDYSYVRHGLTSSEFNEHRFSIKREF